MNRRDALDPGARAIAVVYPLHTGEPGGPALEALVTVNGLALATLGVSGIALWRTRRRARRARAAQAFSSSSPSTR